MEKCRIEATLENLDAALQFVDGQAEAAGLEPGKINKLSLVIEEAFVNVCSYAYKGETGFVELSCENEKSSFVVEISDTGEPFDILSLPAPDTSLDIEERKIGGLGIFFIRRFADKVRYSRDENRNVLRMVFQK